MFAIELETPVHPNCALRLDLNSVPPEMLIVEIVDRCRVWESHDDAEARRIVKPMPERARPVYTVSELAYVPGRGGRYCAFGGIRRH